MSASVFTTEERRQLVGRYHELDHNLTSPNDEQFTIPQCREMIKERRAIMQEYGERLPFVPLSKCPFCGRILEYPMDTGGFDGPWWFKDSLTKYPRPDACPHFRVLLGAVNFKDAKALEGRSMQEIIPGPGVPFVIPRLLAEIPDMRAVVSSFQIPQGYTAYPIAYFSKEFVNGALLHQPWGRQTYDAFDEEGKFTGWYSSNDKWDFDLQPWVDKGLLLWINPGDSSMTLQNQPPCPYVNLPGVRAPQRVMRGVLKTLPLPSGKPVQPFE